MFRCLRIVQIGRSPLPLVVHLHRSPFFSVPSSLLLRLHSHHSRQASLPGFTNEFVHPLFLIFFHFYPFPAYFIRCHPFHPVISICIYRHPFSSNSCTFIYFHPMFSTFSTLIHCHPYLPTFMFIIFILVIIIHLSESHHLQRVLLFIYVPSHEEYYFDSL